MQNPKFATVLGLLLESEKLNAGNYEDYKVNNNHGDLISKLSESLKSVFKEMQEQRPDHKFHHSEIRQEMVKRGFEHYNDSTCRTVETLLKSIE